MAVQKAVLVIFLGVLYCASKYALRYVARTVFPWCDHPTRCFQFAEELASNVDRDVDPCENLFEHVCGRWDRNYPKQGHAGQFKLLQTRVLTSIMRALERPPTHSLPGVRKTVLAYQYCRKVFEEQRDDTKLLFDVFKEFNSEWPSLSLPSNFNVMNFLLGLSLEYDLPTPFVLSLEPHVKTGKRYGLNFNIALIKIQSLYDAKLVAKCIPSLTPSPDIISDLRRIELVYSTVQALANYSQPYATLDVWLNAMNTRLAEDQHIGMDEDVLTFSNSSVFVGETLAFAKRSGYVDLVLFAGWSIMAIFKAAVSYRLADCIVDLKAFVPLTTAAECLGLVNKVIYRLMMSRRINVSKV
ncbi:hypothetical protein V5799_033254 [Amblyomma americanum]|uniref:Peptidase M13 N-terminal domain-containing protein n=1 Tax=Amblyomma americanum TaxID=6943 RepID=A0AAQ4DNU9_AMBAM